jgi:hypothetical protein
VFKGYVEGAFWIQSHVSLSLSGGPQLQQTTSNGDDLAILSMNGTYND